MLPLRAMYRRAASRGEIAVNPTTGLEMPAVRDGRDRIASPDECAGLLEALAEADRPLWATALYAGLRRGELMALRVEDIDLAAGLIPVRRGWTGGLVFGVTSLSPFSPTPVRRRAAVAWKNAGLQAITLHECRHTFAS
jgi:integrase